MKNVVLGQQKMLNQAIVDCTVDDARLWSDYGQRPVDR